MFTDRELFMLKCGLRLAIDKHMKNAGMASSGTERFYLHGAEQYTNLLNKIDNIIAEKEKERIDSSIDFKREYDCKWIGESHE